MPRPRFLLVALVGVLAAACGGQGDAVPGLDPPPGLVVVTAGGTAFVDGADDVPPTLDLRISENRRLDPAAVGLRLDGAAVPTSAAGDAVVAHTTQLALGSAHDLSLAVPGRDPVTYRFHVVRPTSALAALHADPGGGAVLDIALGLPVAQAALAAAIPAGGAATWRDATHLTVRWPAAPGGSLRLPATLSTARGSHLAGDLTLSLTPLAAADGPMRVVTVPAAPPAAAAERLGFAVGTAASRASLAGHADRLTAAAPTGLTAEADGNLVGAPDGAEARAASAAGLPLLPLVQQLDSATAAALAADGTAGSRLAAALRAAAAAGGWAGAQLDVENLPGDSAAGYGRLVATVCAALHADGRRCVVDVVPHRPGHLTSASAGFDLQAIGAVADEVVLMAYEQHGPSTGPGPVAGVDWQDELLAGSLPELGRARVLLGMPLYARTWPLSGAATADSHDGALRTALGTPGAHVDLDPVARTPVVRAADGSETWFDDATSLLWKIDLAHRRGLAGIALWRLGFEDPALWTVLPAAR